MTARLRAGGDGRDGRSCGNIPAGKDSPPAVASILADLASTGVEVFVGESGNLKLIGEQSEIDRWLPEIRAHKAELIAYLVAANDTPAATHRRWLVRYQDGTELSITRCPPAALEQVAADHPSGSVRPDPEPPLGRPLDHEALAIIRAWLNAIGETDPTTRAEYIDGCARDPERLRNTYDVAVALGIAAWD